MFKSEEILTEYFNKALFEDKSPFSPKCIAREFNYIEGRTDVIITDGQGNLLAFEMKLDKWKTALHQAYRNSSFAHYSYVVLPSLTAYRALKNKSEFIRRGIGLCSIEHNKIQIEIDAKWVAPLLPWLTNSAIEYMYGVNNDRSSSI